MGTRGFNGLNGRQLTGHHVFKGLRPLNSRHNCVETHTHTTTLNSTLTSMRVYTNTVWEKVLTPQTAHITTMSVHTSNVWKTLFVGPQWKTTARALCLENGSPPPQLGTRKHCEGTHNHCIEKTACRGATENNSQGPMCIKGLPSAPQAGTRNNCVDIHDHCVETVVFVPQWKTTYWALCL